jgi:hypothetical protein
MVAGLLKRDSLRPVQEKDYEHRKSSWTSAREDYGKGLRRTIKEKAILTIISHPNFSP